MNKKSLVAKKMYEKEGIIVASTKTCEIRRPHYIKTKMRWEDAHNLIEEAAKELTFAYEYAAAQALKKRGPIPIEFDEGVVNVEFVDGGSVKEFYISSVDSLKTT